MTSVLDRLLALVGIKKRDPVCGMYIRPGAAAATSEHAGKTIYFCALGCKTEFDAAPERFT